MVKELFFQKMSCILKTAIKGEHMRVYKYLYRQWRRRGGRGRKGREKGGKGGGAFYGEGTFQGKGQ